MDAEESPMAEMFTLFPHESAAVMQRGIELGIVCSCFLVLHCWILVWRFWGSQDPTDFLLRLLCLARIACAVPRPYFWIRTRRLFVQARYQPTPQLVTRSLLDVYGNPFGIEKALLLFYYGWLAAVSLVAFIFRLYPEESDFTHAIWRHCLFNFISIVVHRILCVLLFYYLMKSDFKRGIPQDMLEKYSKRTVFRSGLQLGGDSDCSICFGPYEEGEEIRKLSCQHHFHQECVDEWLLGHQNRCPLCLSVVGPYNGQATRSSAALRGGL
ncbi:unnamed protein product [Durusdinium trenchii]|uniref:RING-type domain-containing protein n=1 Tax=Durusdinium trenchii TaxID=1381693 RepID=A0ABP0LJN9_9DINO